MKISIEFKNGKYTVTYGKMSATASTPKEAIEILVENFKKQVEKFFLVG